ncbi:MAG: DUF3572 domain-containing protein [Proteobacteria bacterium]|nr:DUF3572 domain-containing protein [Pseudomonadota bacterium]
MCYTVGRMKHPVETGRSDAAQLLAIRCLGFIAEDSDRLGRFLALSGIGPADIRARAADPAFLGGVLDYLLSDDAMVVEFAEWASIGPESVLIARQLMPGAAVEE